MFCSNCGKKLVDGAKFCSFCGSPIILPDDTATEPSDVKDTEKITDSVADETAVADTVSAENETPEEACTSEKDTDGVAISDEATDSVPDEELSAQNENKPSVYHDQPKDTGKKFSRKKLALVITVSVLAAVLLWIGAFFAISALLNNLDAPLGAASEAYVHNGKAYVLLKNGNCVQIGGGGVSQAFLTPDEQYVIVLYEDNSVSLFETDDPDEKKSKIFSASNKEVFIDASSISNEMMVFAADDYIYRYVFDNGVNMVVCDPYDDGFYIVPSSEDYPEYFTVVTASNGKIYIIEKDDKMKRQISSYDKDLMLSNLYVSADGKAVVWTETNTDKNTTNAYIWHGGEKTKLGLLTGLPLIELHSAESSEETVLISAPFDNTLFIKNAGEKAKKVSLPYQPWFIYTTEGQAIASGDKIELQYGILVVACDENEEDAPILLYLVDQEGKYKCLKSKCFDVSFCGGKIIYVDNKGAPHAARFDADTMTLVDEKAIDSAMNDTFYFGSQSSDYYFYTKTGKNGKHSLNVYEVKSKETYLVCEDVLLDDPYTNIMISSDGTKAYYFTDAEYQGGVANMTGSLWVYDANSGESTKIDDNVVVWSLRSSVPYFEIDPNSFYYEVFKEADATEESYKTDIYFFNGKKSKVVITNMYVEVPTFDDLIE